MLVLGTVARAFLAVSVAGGLSGCAAEEPTPEDTAQTRSAICNAGGGGGGDPCTGANGFCPAECGYCFQSESQRVALRNAWQCDTTGGGGGGGGDPGACWPSTDYERTVTQAQYGYGEEAAQYAACDIASADAQSACTASGRLCRATAGPAFTRRGGCTEIGSGHGNYSCTCTARVRCEYSF